MPCDHKRNTSLLTQSTLLFFLLIIASLLLITWLDYLTGNELSFLIFYFVPISAMAWYRGRLAGCLVAIASTVGWWYALYLSHPTFSSDFIYAWNTGVRLVAFLFVALSTARVGSELRQLRQLLPICAWCKKIRDDQGYWQQLETYFQKRDKTEFTHGVCPECSHKFYKPNVLFVDSEASDASALKDAFTKAGLPHILHWVENKQKAMQWLLGCDSFQDRDKYPLPDVLVIDATASPNNSFNLLEWVRSTSDFKQLPVLLAGLPDDDQIKRAYELDADSYFLKSVGYEELTDFLRATRV